MSKIKKEWHIFLVKKHMYNQIMSLCTTHKYQKAKKLCLQHPFLTLKDRAYLRSHITAQELSHFLEIHQLEQAKKISAKVPFMYKPYHDIIVDIADTKMNIYYEYLHRHATEMFVSPKTKEATEIQEFIKKDIASLTITKKSDKERIENISPRNLYFFINALSKSDMHDAARHILKFVSSEKLKLAAAFCGPWEACIGENTLFVEEIEKRTQNKDLNNF